MKLYEVVTDLLQWSSRIFKEYLRFINRAVSFAVGRNVSGEQEA